MTKEQVIEKIQKLLRLANSQNENEAQSAMLMAQKLMAQYKIELSQVEDAEIDHNVVEEEADKKAHSTAWKRQLALLIAQSFQCETYVVGYRSYKTVFIGKQANVKICKQVYEAAIRFIDFNFGIYWRTTGKYKLPRDAKWLGWTELPVSYSIAQKSSYAMGFIHRLKGRFEEQKVKADKEGWGLVLVKDPDVVEYKLNLNLSKSNFTSANTEDSDAYTQGYMDCHSKFGDTGIEKVEQQ